MASPPQEVRDAQHPVAGGPMALEPKSYRMRRFNWADLLFCLPLAVAAIVSADSDPMKLVWFCLILTAVFVLFTTGLRLWLSRPGRKPPITLDAHGLHLPMQYKDPIPWSKIGRIERSYGRWMRWTSVFIDPEHTVIQFPAWPLNRLPEKWRKLSVPMTIISSWNMAVEMDELVEELERFRDNYCAA